MQFPPFAVDDFEANEIARPLARIFARHPEWAEAVRDKGDAFALIIAAFSVTAPRIALYQECRRAAASAVREATTGATDGGRSEANAAPPPSEPQAQHKTDRPPNLDAWRSRMNGN